MYFDSALMLPLAGKLLQRHSSRMLFTAASVLNGLSHSGMAHVAISNEDAISTEGRIFNENACKSQN